MDIDGTLFVHRSNEELDEMIEKHEMESHLQEAPIQEAIDFINNLKIFKIGMSWGGVNSLAVVYPDLIRPNQDFAGRIVRLNIGLEFVDDLIADLNQAFGKMV